MSLPPHWLGAIGFWLQAHHFLKYCIFSIHLSPRDCHQAVPFHCHVSVQDSIDISITRFESATQTHHFFWKPVSCCQAPFPHVWLLHMGQLWSHPPACHIQLRNAPFMVGRIQLYQRYLLVSISPHTIPIDSVCLNYWTGRDCLETIDCSAPGYIYSLLWLLLVLPPVYNYPYLWKIKK